jgi:tetratricopeptide (TPR) repeat protein
MEPLPRAREPVITSAAGMSLQRTLLWFTLSIALVTVNLPCSTAPSGSSEKAPETAAIVLGGFSAGCAVNLDADPQGKTNAQGELALTKVPAGDHYLHIDCTGQPTQVFFVSPKPAGRVDLKPMTAAGAQSPLEAAQSRQELTKLVQKAVQARTAGHQDEAIADLRRATQLDPENPDLHQELGITFLLLKDWERARVEYLEAIRHDPSEAESHNGLGYALEKLGDLVAASREFRAAMQLEPDDKTYQDHYTETILALQELKEREKKK